MFLACKHVWLFSLCGCVSVQYKSQMHLLETSNVEKVVTDVLHGVSQLVPRELALPAVRDALQKVHADLREAKSMLKTAQLNVTNTRDALNALQAR